MTTLSKEDVVRWAREAGCNIITTPDDVIARYNDVRVTNMLGRFAEAARADLLAENERLNKQYLAAVNGRREFRKHVVELRDQLTATRTALAAAEAMLAEARANDIAAMRWLTDCRFAVGDEGKRMLPEFVEYLKELRTLAEKAKVE